MNSAEFVFKAIDVLGYLPQNAVHFSGITCVKDIPYSEKSDKMKGDLYFKPEYYHSKELHPVIVYIHGGGFIKGDKDYRVSVSEYYADKGYFVYCIDYRMPPEAPFPDTVFDCVDAVNYLPELAKKYSIDLDNIVLTGDSSGGYMSAYLASLKYNDELCEKIGGGKINVELKGLMLMCGIYDINILLGGSKMLGVVPETGSMLFGTKLKYDLSNVKDYKYIDWISPADFVNDKWCSAYICWSDDDIVCVGQGKPMAEKLKAVCPVFGSYHCKGILNNHCYHLMLKSNKYAKEAMQSSADFLEEIFTKKEEPATVTAN